MTKQEKLTAARLLIRHQDYRLRCLIRDFEKKSQQAILKALDDAESKASDILEIADSLRDKEIEDSEQQSLIHYANSFIEKRIQLKAKIKQKKQAEGEQKKPAKKPQPDQNAAKQILQKSTMKSPTKKSKAS